MTIEASERDEVSASRCPGGRRVASGRVALVFTSANGKIIVEGGIKDTVCADQLTRSVRSISPLVAFMSKLV